MALGLLLIAIGTTIFIPAAHSRTYLLFLIGQFVQGSGLAILQTAANPYVVILGPRNSAAKRISMMGVSNGVAGILAPIILGSIILDNTDQIKTDLLRMGVQEKIIALQNLASKIIAPYVAMTVVMLILAVLIYFSGLPEINPDEEEEEFGSAESTQKTSIFQFPHLLLGAFTLFLYVGVEVIAGDTIILYGSSQGIPLATAKFFTSFTLGGMLLGYFIGILCIPKLISQEQALKFSALAGILFCLTALFTSGMVSVVFIALLGLANALMYPSIWPLALSGLGSFTKTGSSILIMAIGGGAILPLIYGRIADHFSPHLAYWMVVPCYLVIWYYAAKGHRIKSN